MITAALVPNALSDAERASIFSIISDKMRQACFIDWAVGMIFIAFYGVRIYQMMYGSAHFEATDLWPAVAALCVTRAGQAVRDVAYWIYHKTGEAMQNANQTL